MAYVNHWWYVYVVPTNPFQPGEERTHVWSGDWLDRAVAATAAPARSVSTDLKMLTVAQVRVVSAPGQPGVPGQELGVTSLEVTVKNLGITPIVVYYISLADIAP